MSPDTVRVASPRAFATADVPSERQVELWERHNAESLIALACVPPTHSSFDAIEVNLQLPGLHLARVHGTGHRVDRTPGLIEEHPADAIAVYVTLRGDAVLEYAGTKRVLAPGQLLVCDADRPFVRGFGHGLEELAVKVPRAAFAELTGMRTVPTPIVVDAAPPHGRSAVGRHGRALARLVGRAVRTRYPLPADERTILELVGVLAGGAETAPALAHRAAARAYIDEHFTDPDLSAKVVAAAVGVSERHISRIFAEAGTSVPRQVLSRRLDAAYHLLATITDRSVLTADVAARCGFTSSAYFAQRFRARFEVRAGEVRRSALAA